MCGSQKVADLICAECGADQIRHLGRATVFVRPLDHIPAAWKEEMTRRRPCRNGQSAKGTTPKRAETETRSTGKTKAKTTTETGSKAAINRAGKTTTNRKRKAQVKKS